MNSSTNPTQRRFQNCFDFLVRCLYTNYCIGFCAEVFHLFSLGCVHRSSARTRFARATMFSSWRGEKYFHRRNQRTRAALLYFTSNIYTTGQFIAFKGNTRFWLLLWFQLLKRLYYFFFSISFGTIIIYLLLLLLLFFFFITIFVV